MNKKERSTRQTEVEDQIETLVKKGRHVERIVYDDEENEPFRVAVNLRLDGSDPRKSIL